MEVKFEELVFEVELESEEEEEEELPEELLRLKSFSNDAIIMVLSVLRALGR